MRGELIVDRLCSLVVGRGFELDFGLEAILFLIEAQHAIERAIHGVVIDVRDFPEMRVLAELVHGHAGITRDRDPAHARTRSRNHAKRNVGELFLRTRGNGMCDGGFEIAVLLEHGMHLLRGARHLFLGQARTRIQLAGSLQLHIHSGAGSAVHAHAPDKGAWRPGKNQSYAVSLARAMDLNGVVEAGGIQLAQAAFQVILGQRRSFSLGQVAGKGLQLIGRNALESNAANSQALPCENGTGRLNGMDRGLGSRRPGGRCALRVADYGSGLGRHRGRCRRLAPTVAQTRAANQAGNQKQGSEQDSGAYRARGPALPFDWDRTQPASGSQVSTTPFFRLCPQDHIFKRRGVTECQIKAKEDHRAMSQGIGCSRFSSMVSQPRYFPLY